MNKNTIEIFIQKIKNEDNRELLLKKLKESNKLTYLEKRELEKRIWNIEF